MLAYFHFACAGSYPLSIAWDKSLEGSEKDPSWMTRDQIKYLGSVQQMMNAPGEYERFNFTTLAKGSFS